ncbi:helix-turn-helix domain-containing protein [Aestuariivivens sediminicola]|uniref:helix-turn-helix domain-containing protein n=1 Tax=Aestuariivivens sediminicola TaxID=2913560 RepID=UPI001F5915AF|nr:helix-turn-helix domain-containing protein [Aestuariivivens sediminicola]
MQQVQFIGITPEGLVEKLKESILPEMEEFTKNFEPKEPPVFLTRNQVAEMLSVDLSTVHNYTKKEILIAYQLGGRIYYKRSEVENAMTRLKR